MQKILVVQFHCDNCGKDFDVFGTNTEEEKENKYHCIYCGTKGSKVYVYNDFYAKKLK